MALISLSVLLGRLRARPAGAVVFLHGDEEYLRENGVKQVLDIVLDPPTRDFNFDQIRGSDAAPETLASILGTPPMLAEYRVVVIRDAQGLSPKAREVVEGALQSGLIGTILILVASIPAASKAKFYDNLKAKGLSVAFPSLDPVELPGWIVEHAASAHQVEVEMDAARALAVAIGSQLGALTSEIDKLVAYVGDRTEVTLEDVRAVGGYIPRVDRWGWFDRIGERRFAEVVEELPDLLDSGETAVGLLIGIGSHLLRLGVICAGGRDALDRHLNSRQGWLVNRLAPQARLWTVHEIDEALRDALRADRLLKSASLSDRQVLEEYLLRLEVERTATATTTSSTR
jgi:DNA polymerase III subunit delta